MKNAGLLPCFHEPIGLVKQAIGFFYFITLIKLPPMFGILFASLVLVGWVKHHISGPDSGYTDNNFNDL